MAIKFVLLLALVSTISAKSDYAFVNSGYLPVARADTAAYYDGENFVYILGGRGGDNEEHVIFDDILRYNLNTTKVDLVGKFPAPVTQGSFGTDGNGNIYYFGGQDMLTQTADIYKFNISNPNAVFVGKLPVTTYGQSTASDGLGNMYIIGGMSDNYKHLNTIYRYNNETIEQVGEMEYGLFETSATVYEDSVVIFGGISDEAVVGNKINVFTPSTGNIENLNTNMKTGLTHSPALLVDNYVYLFGGLPEAGQPPHELSRVNLKTGDTKYFSLGGIGIWRGSSAVYVEKYNRIYIFGGHYWEFDYEYARNNIMYIQL